MKEEVSNYEIKITKNHGFWKVNKDKSGINQLKKLVIIKKLKQNLD